MNNPNMNYVVGPVMDAEADFDHEGFMDHVFDALTVRETEIRRWFEAERFVDVRVRRLPLLGPDNWECLMLREGNSACCICDDVKALVTRLARDFGSEVQQDEIRAVVWGDRVVAQFQLMPQPD